MALLRAVLVALGALTASLAAAAETGHTVLGWTEVEGVREAVDLEWRRIDTLTTVQHCYKLRAFNTGGPPSAASSEVCAPPIARRGPPGTPPPAPPGTPPPAPPPAPPPTGPLTNLTDWVASKGGLSVTVRRGQHDGASYQYELKPEPEDYYARYRIWFDPSYRRSGGTLIGKLPGFAATYGRCGWGGRRADGSCWSARLFPYQASNGIALGYYLYHMDMGQWGDDNRRWPGTLAYSQWHCVEQHVKLNTPGQANGLLEAWVNGTSVYRATNVRFRNTPTAKVQAFWWDIYVGGSWVAEQDMTVKFDQVAVGPQRLGCGGPAQRAPRGPGPR